MCAVSAVGDNWQKEWPGIWPNAIPPYMPQINVPLVPPVDRKEFDRLKAEVEKMKKELEAARVQDILDRNPDCEMEDKVALLKAVAKAFDVDLKGVFPND